MNYTNDVFKQRFTIPICLFCQQKIDDGRKTASTINLKCHSCSLSYQMNVLFFYWYSENHNLWQLDGITLENTDWDYLKYFDEHVLYNKYTDREYKLPFALCLTPLDFEKIDNILPLL